MEAKQETSPKEATSRLVRSALKASLATLDRLSGHPYASLVTIATEADGSPLMLISRLAVHTQNIEADPRVSLLFDGTDPAGDPLAGGRVTLLGTAQRTDNQSAKLRFLARQPHAAMYAEFADFSFYRVQVERAHFIGGFGRIVDLSAQDLVLDLSGANDLVSAETEIVEHMNSDHSAALELYATELCAAASGPWRMTGIDPAGLDLVCDGRALRIPFTTPVTTPAQARIALKQLTDEARLRRNKV